ncbi:MAG: hypothetical protein RR012_07170 [Oscillospiraceae bacterium]
MLNKRLETFVIKRAVAYFLLLSIIFALIVENRWIFILGFAVGTMFSIVRFLLYAFASKVTSDIIKLKNRSKKVISINYVIFILHQFLILFLLYFSYKYDIYLFAGVVAGTLMVAFVIMINVITEFLGITKNHFFI